MSGNNKRSENRREITLKAALPEFSTIATVIMALVLASSMVAASHVAGSAVDDFEDGDVNGWSTSNNELSISSSTTSTNGDYSMFIDMEQSDGEGEVYWDSGPSSINNYGHAYVTGTIRTSAEEYTDDRAAAPTVNSGDGHFRIRFRTDSNIADVQAYEIDQSTVNTQTITSISQGTWYRFNLSVDGSTIRAKVWEATEDEPDNWGASVNNVADWDSSGTVRVDARGSNTYVDDIAVNDNLVERTISGTVTQPDGNPIGQATVEASSGGSVVSTATTSTSGQYNLSLTDGEYTLTADADGYEENSTTVTVSGADLEQNFTLTGVNHTLDIDTRPHLDHGQRASYVVVIEYENGTRENVSSQSTVTSGDTNVITIDSSALEVVATSDESVNNRTFVKAEYTSGGDTYTDQQNVTVANKTVANTEILPIWSRITAAIQDQTFQVILIATWVAAVAALFSTSFAGVAAFTLVMLLGWAGGRVSTGMMLATVVTATMIGLNVAGNVDYSVRR